MRLAAITPGIYKINCLLKHIFLIKLNFRIRVAVFLTICKIYWGVKILNNVNFVNFAPEFVFLGEKLLVNVKAKNIRLINYFSKA